MNHRINLTLLGAILIFSANQAVSATPITLPQQPTTASQNPQGEGARNRADLNLTADQKAQLKAIHQRTREQMQALRNDQTLTPEQRHEKARSIREATHQQARSVLTPQQQELAGNNRMERHGRGMGRGAGRGEEGRELLNLTADQRAQLKSIHENTKNQVGAIRNDSTLTLEQKQEKIRSIHQSIRQQVSGILTPEQQQKMKEGRRGGRHGGRDGGPGRFGGPRGGRGDFPGATPSPHKPLAKPSDKP